MPPSSTLPGVPESNSWEPPAGSGSEPPPAKVGDNNALSASFRVGYTQYLRTADTSQVAAFAVPGVVGLLALTGAGGLVGYRQAKAGHVVHSGGAARFMT